ncbi:MAG: glycosyltransferase family 4 protein [Elusimicrobia bacterium]|nr:glycosyltransferase family 4 protein [Candidatus Liberimonas magnetica]
MNKIKVCHIITKLELGGAQQNTLYTLERLNKEEFDTILISGTGGILDDEALAISKTKVYFVNCLVREIAPIKDICALINLFSILKKEKPAIVHTHSSKAGILGRLAAFIAGVPVIIHTFHGFGFHSFQKFPVRMLYIFLERVTAKISDKLIAVSKENIEKGLGNNIGLKEQYALIRSGIKIDKYKDSKGNTEEKKKELNIPDGVKVIITIGPFKPQKNLMDFVDVANQVYNAYDKCIFLIVGDGEERKKIEKAINSLNLTDKIKLLGWRRDIPELLNISNLFVMTSLWEGLPRACLEAMCCGLPVVANSVDGLRDIVANEENGFLSEPGATSRMAENIARLLKNQELADKMGKRSKELIGQDFDIDHMVKQQEELYKSLTISIGKNN